MEAVKPESTLGGRPGPPEPACVGARPPTTGHYKACLPPPASCWPHSLLGPHPVETVRPGVHG